MYINQDLVGRSDAGRELSTPALLIDLDVLERNIARMAEHCRKSGLALRPHAKTHKSAAIAKAQIAAGAVGVCCAKVGEAEALSFGGVDDILITSPVAAPRTIERLATLNQATSGLMVVVDHPRGATLLSQAAQRSGKPITVLVDVDPGMGRTGAAPGEAALTLGKTVDALPYLILAGLQCYDGDVQHLYGLQRRRRRSALVMELLAQTRDAFGQAGLNTAILSGGGTGSHDIDPAAGVLTELQAGSYIFMDRQYNELEHAEARPPFETALFVQTTV
ncbi:MAG: alanine racemase, partial [Caulobacter sp.]